MYIQSFLGRAPFYTHNSNVNLLHGLQPVFYNYKPYRVYGLEPVNFRFPILNTTLQYLYGRVCAQ